MKEKNQNYRIENHGFMITICDSVVHVSLLNLRWEGVKLEMCPRVLASVTEVVDVNLLGALEEVDLDAGVDGVRVGAVGEGVHHGGGLLPLYLLVGPVELPHLQLVLEKVPSEGS